MWCRHVRSQLSAYADGELKPAEARSVEEHLARCEECCHEYSSLQQLVRLTTAIPAEDVPNGLHSSIIARLTYADAPAARRSPRPSAGFGLSMFNPWMWTALSGATAALLVGLVPRPDRPSAAPAAEQPAREHRAGEAAAKTSPAPAPELAPRGQNVTATPASEPPGAPIRQASIPQVVAGGAAGAVEGIRTAAPAGLSARTRPAAPRREREPLEFAPDAPGPVVSEPEGVGRSIQPNVPPAMAAMPGEPMVNSVTAPPSPDALGPGAEKESPTRMAGSAEPEMPVDEDEGVRTLRMFLEERNRSVPQPPAAPPANRRKL